MEREPFCFVMFCCKDHHFVTLNCCVTQALIRNILLKTAGRLLCSKDIKIVNKNTCISNIKCLKASVRQKLKHEIHIPAGLFGT